MNLTKKQTSTLNKILSDYSNIDSVKDLNKRRLTLSDYESIRLSINELKDKRETCTVVNSVATYLKRFGISVVQFGVGYKCSL